MVFSIYIKEVNMNAKERHEFFRTVLTEFREICSKKKIAVGERKFFEFIKKKVSEKEWDHMEPHLDRVKAKLPHHLHANYDPIKAAKKNRRWLANRYLFMFGPRVCETCGGRKGPMFRDLENIGTGFKSMWHRYCSNSCSKKSERAFSRREATCIKKYKVANVANSKHFRKKMKDYWRQFDEAQREHRNEKAIQTKIRKHGSLEKAEKVRAAKMIETNMERYGGPAATCNEEVRKKVEQTNLQRRGVTNPSKDPGVMQKIQESWKNRKEITVNGKTFTGLQGYEPQAIKWLVSKGIKTNKISRPRVAIPYEFDDEEKHYHPDLMVKQNGTNILVEIKSVYTSSIFEDTPKSHNFGNYRMMRAKINACVEEGYETRLVIVHGGDCFVWKNELPKNRKIVARAFKKWLKDLSRAS